MNATSRGWLAGGWALCLAMLVVASVSPLGCKSSAEDRPNADWPATGATTTAPSGAAAGKSPKELALAEFLKTMKLEGQPVFIEFGLVGCELSQKGLDNMIALQRAGAVPGLALVRVEGGFDPAAVDKYYAATAVPFPVYKDTGSALATSLGATAFPTFVLADKFGHIRYTGTYPQEHLVDWGKTLVAETQDPGSQVALFGAKRLDVPKLLGDRLPDLNDKPRALREYMGPGGLMVLFVDTQCPYSTLALKEMPMVAKALTDRRIIAVAVNSDDPRERVLDFYAKNNPGAAVLYDVGAATRERWNVQSVPIAVYISPAGKVVYQGEAIWANMGSAIDASLGIVPGTTRFTSPGTGFG